MQLGPARARGGSPLQLPMHLADLGLQHFAPHCVTSPPCPPPPLAPQELKLQYGQAKGKAYTEEEDRFLVRQGEGRGSSTERRREGSWIIWRARLSMLLVRKRWSGQLPAQVLKLLPQPINQPTAGRIYPCPALAPLPPSPRCA